MTAKVERRWLRKILEWKSKGKKVRLDSKVKIGKIKRKK